MKLTDYTIETLHDAYVRGDFTVVEVISSVLETIKEKNGEINAYREVYDDVLIQAEKADQRFKDKTATLFTGIPVALKDNILLTGKIAGASSKMLEGYVATYDAHVTSILKEQGVVFIGRTNMDEFAMGSSTETSPYGVTKNPHDISRVAGGSSGGSAAAVAMGGALIALGSDTGGSIRQPAGLCGIVGLKPTYGTISRSGVIALASSLDQIGPFTNTTRDAELVFDLLSKHDPKDSTSIKEEKRIAQGTTEKKIGVPKSFIFRDGLDPETKKRFEESLSKLESLGYEIVDIDIPLLPFALPVYYIIQPAECSANLARFDGLRYGPQEEGVSLLETYMKTRGDLFGKEVRRRIILGTYVLSHGYVDAYYGKAVLVTSAIKEQFKKIFETVSVIATPTTPAPAFKIGEKTSDPLQMYLSDIFTVAANVTGVPAISIPAGVNSEGLPLDIQFMAPHFGEKTLFTIANLFEKA